MFKKENVIVKSESLIDCAEINYAAHIAFAVDENYLKHTGTTIFSIIHNNPDLVIHFHLLIDKITNEDLEKLKKLVNVPHVKCQITLHYLNTAYFDDLHICSYFSTAMYYRLIIPTVLYPFTDKVLYLDSDILCLGTLHSLFEIDMTRFAAATVFDESVDLRNLPNIIQWGFQETNPYFNSGVILFHIPEWHKLNLNQKLADLMQQIGNQPLKFPDQDLLNIVLQGHIRFLPELYNWVRWQQRPDILIENRENIRLVHFIGSIKPWHKAGFVAQYDYYRKQTPWRDMAYIDLPNHTAPKLNTKIFRLKARSLWLKGEWGSACWYYLQYLIGKIKGKS